MIETKINLKLYTLLMVLLIVSCKKETRDKIQNAKKEVKAATTIIGNANSMQEKVAELTNKEPLTSEQLKSWLPESLNGMDRTGFKIGNNTFATATSVKGTYKADDKEFIMEIVDGAGAMAGLVIMSGVANKMEMEEEDEYKHIKTIKRDDIEAKQTYYKKQNRTTLKFLYKDRFMVDIRANEMGVEETWAMLDELDLEKLTSMAE